MSGEAPNFADVLAAVEPGRVVRLALTPDQKRALRDPDGQLALDVVRHLLGARAVAAPGRRRFPLTEATLQAVARKLGRPAGIKRYRAMLRRLVAHRVLGRAGSYRQVYRTLGVSGYRVALYRLAALVAPLRPKRPIGRRRPSRAGGVAAGGSIAVRGRLGPASAGHDAGEGCPDAVAGRAGEGVALTAALRPCIRCGRLNRGRSYCPGHEPAHPSPSSLLGRVPGLRRKARARDGHRCLRCGHPGSKANPLEVHHRAEVATHGREANRLELMVTLCRDCHRTRHPQSRRA